MAVEKFFVKEGIKESQLEEFLKEKFEKAGYSHSDIQRTPLGTRIVVYAEKPGLVVGKSGKKITDITEEIKEKFQVENPMLDVKEVEQPFLDAQIVANKIARALEKGGFYKKVAGYYMDKVIEAGAIGVEIRIGGKLGSERARFQKFRQGYIKHSGYYADTLVRVGYAQALVKLGIIGVQVRILTKMPEEVNESLFKGVKENEEKGLEKNE
ncbi:MAG: 30S ribosomal protein S3 [Candidatus Aenigmarchaeota archaeon]|nr:30S ribosomal protein S3 [Candidatus Aenigmarchaeota archaeon]MCX8179495.1 30S ribosomal protein S3 [Candidatus Aenigmarchaeota archaeon]